MNDMTLHVGAAITMTSLELVEFINNVRAADAKAAGVPFPSSGYAELQHKHFMDKVLVVLGERSAEFSADLPDSYGRPRKAYRFPKRESCLMAMSYSYDLQAKVFDRMTALEEQAAKPQHVIPQSLPEALRLAADLADQRNAAQAALAIAAPKAEALDRIATADGSMCITDAAKALQMPPKKLFDYLKENGWIYRRVGGNGWKAHQAKINSGLMEHKVTTIERGDGSEKCVEQALVTARGLTRLSERCGGACHAPH